MTKPVTKKPRLVEVSDSWAIEAIRRGMAGDLKMPLGFTWDGKWWAEVESLHKWRDHRDDPDSGDKP